MLNRRLVSVLVALTAMLAFGHLFASSGDPHAVVEADQHASVADEHPPAHDDEAPSCGRVSLPTLNACAPLECTTHSVLSAAAEHGPAVDCRSDAADRRPPDLVAFLQVNRV